MASKCIKPLQTVEYVSMCPLDVFEWNERAKSKQCNGLSITACHYKRKLEYHCLRNVYRNATTEVCTQAMLIPKGFCPFFAIKGSRFFQINTVVCTTDIDNSCPQQEYLSTNLTYYPGCLKKTTGNAAFSPVLPDSSFKITAAAIFIGILCLFLGIVLAVMIWTYKAYQKIGSHTQWRKELIAEFESPLEMSSMSAVEPKELRILLYGPTGSGKSSVGNMILDRKSFKVCMTLNGCTLCCQKDTAYRFGRKIEVLDTPGYAKMSTKEIDRGLNLLGKPNAVLLILSVSRLTFDLETCTSNLKDICGRNIDQMLFIVFTKKDELQRHCMSLSDYIQTLPFEMSKLLNKCNNKVKSVNNLKSSSDNAAFVKELIEEIVILSKCTNKDRNIHPPIPRVRHTEHEDLAETGALISTVEVHTECKKK